MGWLIRALANIFIEILADLMTWTVGLVKGLYLDIGMDSNAQGASVPPIGTYIKPTVPKSNLFDTIFPQASQFTTLFMVLAGLIIVFLFFMKLMLSFGGPFVKAEKAGTIYIRTALAIAGTAYSYSIFLFFESLFNSVYQKFMGKYTELTTGAGAYSLDLDNGGPAGTPEDAFNMLSEKLIAGYEDGQGLGLSLLTIALFTVLIISFFKLVLEIYERYVMLGVLFYTSPLAFSTIVSRDMNVFSSWCQMVISEFVVMCSNLFFTGVFISGWTHMLEEGKANNALFSDPQDFITSMFIMISWLIIGQQFDQHLKTLGLSTAQTGRGLGGALAAGFGTAAAAARMGFNGLTKAGREANKLANGQTGFQKAWRDGTGMPGAFKSKLEDANTTKDVGEGLLNDINEQHAKGYTDPDNAAFLMDNINDPGFQKSEDFKNLNGSDLTDAMKTAGGEDLDNFFRDNYGVGTDSINPDDTYYESFMNNDGSYGGRITGTIDDGTTNGQQFSVDVGSAESNDFNAMPIGSSFSAPQNYGEVKNTSQQYANSLNAKAGKETHWEVDSADPRFVARYDKVGKESVYSGRQVTPTYKNQLGKEKDSVVKADTMQRATLNRIGGPSSQTQGNPNMMATGAPIASRAVGPNIPPQHTAVNNNTVVNRPKTIIERDFSGRHGSSPRERYNDPHNLNPYSNDDKE